MLLTILPEGKLKRNYWYTCILMNYLQQRCTVIHAKWCPNGRQAESMNEEGRGQGSDESESHVPTKMQLLPQHPLQALIAPNTGYAELCTQCPLQHRTPSIWLSDYAVLLHVGRKEGLTVVQPAIPSVHCQITVVREQRNYCQPVLDEVISLHFERSDGSTGTTPGSAASISYA
ncbi:hypothetical protein WA026_022648 [Henosepilachna vigintioctopunctata]|uniref:Uncharacterized protein n=1 Tax=Henosepilachna vigintioctopunctata TaxID=420089 RepID=A0AAW1UBS6_9CUCU